MFNKIDELERTFGDSVARVVTGGINDSTANSRTIIWDFFLKRTSTDICVRANPTRRFYRFCFSVIRLAIPDKIDNNAEPAGFAASGVTKCRAKTEMRIINGNWCEDGGVGKGWLEDRSKVERGKGGSSSVGETGKPVFNPRPRQKNFWI